MYNVRVILCDGLSKIEIYVHKQSTGMYTSRMYFQPSCQVKVVSKINAVL